ncbi:PREDICTED: uncharacterized protein LOC104753556 [Camelina sativa]|uniref:Uncharacterized protein LOC104753556 n=1 Tax=Camelina sativa TaxID=90675 RepID=A0ABM0WPB7_CAMSA|nr:PREDICTED: uncharacterized protein LOC104753556 [Camelina sativa]
MVRHCGLLEFPSLGDSLSWRGWRDKKPIRCRLDRVLANEQWHDMFTDSFTEYLTMIASDHKPVLAVIADKTQRGRRSFRFDRRWLDKEGFFGAIAEGWNVGSNLPNTSLVDKVATCCRYISQWRNAQVPFGQETIEDLKSKLAAAQENDATSVDELAELTWQLREAYRDEEVYWYQIIRSRWMRLGDHNTSYFHAQTKQRRVRNRIVGLHDQHGIWSTEDNEVQNIAVSYFQDLFTSSNPSESEETLGVIDASISPRSAEIF